MQITIREYDLNAGGRGYGLRFTFAVALPAACGRVTCGARGWPERGGGDAGSGVPAG